MTSTPPSGAGRPPRRPIREGDTFIPGDLPTTPPPQQASEGAPSGLRSRLVSAARRVARFIGVHRRPAAVVVVVALSVAACPQCTAPVQIDDERPAVHPDASPPVLDALDRAFGTASGRTSGPSASGRPASPRPDAASARTSGTASASGQSVRTSGPRPDAPSGEASARTSGAASGRPTASGVRTAGTSASGRTSGTATGVRTASARPDATSGPTSRQRGAPSTESTSSG